MALFRCGGGGSAGALNWKKVNGATSGIEATEAYFVIARLNDTPRLSGGNATSIDTFTLEVGGDRLNITLFKDENVTSSTSYTPSGAGYCVYR